MDARVKPAHDAACNSKSSDQHDEHKVSSPLKHRTMQPRTVLGEAAKDNPGDGRRRRQRADDGSDRDGRRPFGRKSVDAGGDRRKSDRCEGVALAQLDGAAIAGGQCIVLTVATAMPYRPDGMNDMPGRKPVTFGDFGIAGGAAAEAAAFGQKLRSGGAMDGAIDAAAAEQRFIGGVDDGVNAQGGDVGGDDLEPGRADLACGRNQAEAGAALVTPFSANSCCSSPAWNISRMMSQPPTNSPLT
jgi:hypothetical protein